MSVGDSHKDLKHGVTAALKKNVSAIHTSDAKQTDTAPKLHKMNR